MIAFHSSGLPGGRGVLGIAVALIILSACDSAPADIIGDLNAAREGCTEEKLKASDEECIRMFETYAEMGADAMETYIGGMKAFDQALQRRGGIQFDTAGLGRAFSAPMNGDVPDSLAGVPIDDGMIRRPDYADNPDEGGLRADSRQLAEPTGRWADMPPQQGGVWTGAEQPPVATQIPGGARAPMARRGALLPPDQRLRRPWIGDEVAPDPYVEDATPVVDPRPRPTPSGAGWDAEPTAEPGMQRRE